MIFVDTNVIVHAVGRPHPLRAPSQHFFARAAGSAGDLVTSAEVLQELLHLYVRQQRWATLDAALELASSILTTWSVEEVDVLLARSLAARHPELDARDLLHLACCRRRGVRSIKTYDSRLEAAVVSSS